MPVEYQCTNPPPLSTLVFHRGQNQQRDRMCIPANDSVQADDDMGCGYLPEYIGGRSDGCSLLAWLAKPLDLLRGST